MAVIPMAIKVKKVLIAAGSEGETPID